MALPEHTCISCVYLVQPDKGIIPLVRREKAFIDGNDGGDDIGINYLSLVCYKGKEYFSRLDINSMAVDIHNSIIKPNPCEEWAIFEEISAEYTDPDTDLKIPAKRSKKSIMKTVAKISLAIAFFGMLITFIITLIIWYLDKFVFD